METKQTQAIETEYKHGKAIKVATNKAGKKYALVPWKNAFSVWTQKKNYCAHVYGGIAGSWAYCQLGMTLLEAEVLFAKKLRGKATR
jgi:hypothetical protein